MAVLILGTGHFLPPKQVENKDLLETINTTEDFIVSRTGVLTRRHVESHLGVKDLLVPACKAAINNAGLNPSDIDMLIVNTLSPDHHDPSEACLIQPLIGLGKVPSMDIRAQCSGLLYGMDIATQFIKTSRCKYVLVACGEVLSKRMDVSDEGRNLSILLGDGAGAVVLGHSYDHGLGVIDIITRADGAFYELLWTQAPGSANASFSDDESACFYFRMNGKEMFNHAVECMAEVVHEILLKNKITMADIDIVIPHQPNLRILEALMQKLGIPESKVSINVHRYGNMASASLAITLSECTYDRSTLQGKKALIVGYGSGATWGAILYQF